MGKYIKVQKDIYPHTSKNNVVYKIVCNNYDASYVGWQTITEKNYRTS